MTQYIFPKHHRIIVLSDIHGSFQLLIDCLKLGSILKGNPTKDIYKPSSYEYIGKDTFVILTGDLTDSCRPSGTKICKNMKLKTDKPEDLEILHFTTDLDKIAQNHNGRILNLLGNHEIMNVEGFTNYKSRENLKQFNPSEWAPGGKTAKFLANTRETAIIVGSLLFVHGNMLQFPIENLKPSLQKSFLEDLNIKIKKWLLGELKNEDKMEGIGTLNELLNNANISPFWNRVLSTLPTNLPLTDERCIKYMNKLKLYNAKHIIIGHTPQLNDGINSTCENIYLEN